MGCHVEPDQITFHTATGARCVIRLDPLIPKDGQKPTAPQLAMLLQMGSFYQLAQISGDLQALRAQIGTVDIAKAEGTGLSGLAAQQATSLLEISGNIGTLTQVLGDLVKAQGAMAATATAMDPAKIVKTALKTLQEAGLAPQSMTPPEPDTTGPRIVKPSAAAGGGVTE